MTKINTIAIHAIAIPIITFDINTMITSWQSPAGTESLMMEVDIGSIMKDAGRPRQSAQHAFSDTLVLCTMCLPSL